MASTDQFNLTPQPMIHVADLAGALEFYEALGAKLVLGNREGDWALIEFSGSRIGLLAHPPGDGRRETIELHFTCDQPIEWVEAKVMAIDPSFIDRPSGDVAFGRMLKLRAPDGLLVKVVEINRDSVEAS